MNHTVKKNASKFISIILSVVLCIGMCVPVFAADDYTMSLSFVENAVDYSATDDQTVTLSVDLNKQLDTTTYEYYFKVTNEAGEKVSFPVMSGSCDNLVFTINEAGGRDYVLVSNGASDILTTTSNIGKFNMKVPAGTAAGKYTVSVQCVAMKLTVEGTAYNITTVLDKTETATLTVNDKATDEYSMSLSFAKNAVDYSATDDQTVALSVDLNKQLDTTTYEYYFKVTNEAGEKVSFPVMSGSCDNLVFTINEAGGRDYVLVSNGASDILTTTSNIGKFNMKVPAGTAAGKYTVSVQCVAMKLTVEGTAYNITTVLDKTETATLTVNAASETPTVENKVTISDSSISNGSVVANKQNAKAGETVTLTVTPEEGYKVKSVTVTDADGHNVPVSVSNTDVQTLALDTANAVKYTFTMPATAVTVTAEFEAVSTDPGEKSVYTVSIADKTEGTATVYAGDTVEMDVVVSGGAYNAVYANVNYDLKAFEYVGSSATDVTVDSTTAGVLKLTKQSETDCADGSVVTTLKFKALGKVTGEYAFDFAKATGQTFENALIDAVEANVTGDKVKIAPFAVTLDDKITGEATAINGIDYTAKIKDFDYDNYNYVVYYTVGGQTAQAEYDTTTGSFTIDGVKITGAMSITVQRSIKNASVTLYNDYVTGYTLIEVKYTGEGEKTPAYEYNGKMMYYVDGYKASAWLVEGTVNEADVQNVLTVSVDKTAEVIAKSNDVNGSGYVDVSDATAAFGCYKVVSKYPVADYMAMYLRADVNADHAVNVTDVNAVLKAVNF